jgi:hypothetical protein
MQRFLCSAGQSLRNSLARSPARCAGAGFLNGGGAVSDGHSRASGKGQLGPAPWFCGTVRARTRVSRQKPLGRQQSPICPEA